MHATHDDPVADALRSLSQATRAQARLAHINEALWLHLERQLADHSGIDNERVRNWMNALTTDDLFVSCHPDGLAALAVAMAREIGGICAPLPVTFH